MRPGRALYAAQFGRIFAIKVLYSHRSSSVNHPADGDGRKDVWGDWRNVQGIVLMVKELFRKNI
jgi:hypothetical protein